MPSKSGRKKARAPKRKSGLRKGRALMLKHGVKRSDRRKVRRRAKGR